MVSTLDKKLFWGFSAVHCVTLFTNFLVNVSLSVCLCCLTDTVELIFVAFTLFGIITVDSTAIAHSNVMLSAALKQF